MRRGISPVIATVLLLVIVVAITVGAYYFFTSVLSRARAPIEAGASELELRAELESKVKVDYLGVENDTATLIVSNEMDSPVTIEFLGVGASTTPTVNVGAGEHKAITVKCSNFSVSSGSLKVVIYVKKGSISLRKTEFTLNCG